MHLRQQSKNIEEHYPKALTCFKKTILKVAEASGSPVVHYASSAQLQQHKQSQPATLNLPLTNLGSIDPHPELVHLHTSSPDGVYATFEKACLFKVGFL